MLTWGSAPPPGEVRLAFRGLGGGRRAATGSLCPGAISTWDGVSCLACPAAHPQAASEPSRSGGA